MPSRKIKQKTVQDHSPKVAELFKTIKPVLKTKVEHQVFYKSLIPMQVKVIRQKLKSVLSFK